MTFSEHYRKYNLNHLKNQTMGELTRGKLSLSYIIQAGPEGDTHTHICKHAHTHTYTHTHTHTHT